MAHLFRLKPVPHPCHGMDILRLVDFSFDFFELFMISIMHRNTAFFILSSKSVSVTQASNRAFKFFFFLQAMCLFLFAHFSSPSPSSLKSLALDSWKERTGSWSLIITFVKTVGRFTWELMQITMNLYCLLWTYFSNKLHRDASPFTFIKYEFK